MHIARALVHSLESGVAYETCQRWFRSSYAEAASNGLVALLDALMEEDALFPYTADFFESEDYEDLISHLGLELPAVDAELVAVLASYLYAVVHEQPPKLFSVLALTDECEELQHRS